jgi:hypothetical protein
MNDDRLNIGTRIVLILNILFFVGLGSELVFFQFWFGKFDGAKLIDPEMTRYFGVMLLGFAVLSVQGLLSNSVKVVRPIILASLFTFVGAFIANLYHFMFVHLQVFAVYLSVAVETFVGALLALLVFYSLKKTTLTK